MSNEKQLIRWERHYSDGSVEYTDEESTKNFEDNLSSVGGLIASRSYIQMKPVEWQESKAENLPISDVRLSLPDNHEEILFERLSSTIYPHGKFGYNPTEVKRIKRAIVVAKEVLL